MLDRCVKKALIFESDAPRIMEAIPFWASEQVADHAPVDTDILLIRSQRVGRKPPGPLVFTLFGYQPDDSSEKQTINIPSMSPVPAPDSERTSCRRTLPRRHKRICRDTGLI